MNVNEALQEINLLDSKLDLIEHAKSAGFDAELPETEIEAVKERIGDLYSLKICGATVQIAGMKLRRRIAKLGAKIVKSAYERLFGEMEE